jgi:uncharacterized OB-fold protein
MVTLSIHCWRCGRRLNLRESQLSPDGEVKVAVVADHQCLTAGETAPEQEAVAAASS